MIFARGSRTARFATFLSSFLFTITPAGGRRRPSLRVCFDYHAASHHRYPSLLMSLAQRERERENPSPPLSLRYRRYHYRSVDPANATDRSLLFFFLVTRLSLKHDALKVTLKSNQTQDYYDIFCLVA